MLALIGLGIRVHFLLQMPAATVSVEASVGLITQNRVPLKPSQRAGPHLSSLALPQLQAAALQGVGCQTVKLIQPPRRAGLGVDFSTLELNGFATGVRFSIYSFWFVAPMTFLYTIKKKGSRNNEPYAS